VAMYAVVPVLYFVSAIVVPQAEPPDSVERGFT